MPPLPLLLTSIWAACIGYLDWRYRRIPNVLSLGAWLAGTSTLAITHRSAMAAPPESAGMAAGLALLLTLPGYMLGKLGAGDVKFLVAIGILTSLPLTLQTFVLAALVGAFIALFWMSTPWLSVSLPPALTHNGHAFGRWLATPVAERRMAYGTLLAFALLYSLWKDFA